MTYDNPCSYFNDSNLFAIFPGPDHGWELCWMPDADSGYEYLDWFPTVAKAKADAQWRVERDARRG